MPQPRIAVQLGDGSFTKLKVSSVRKHLLAGRGKYDADGIFVFTANPPACESSRVLRRHRVAHSPNLDVRQLSLADLLAALPKWPQGNFGNSGCSDPQMYSFLTYPQKIGGMGEMMPNGKRSQHPALARPGAGL